jgi:hypothetical protein
MKDTLMCKANYAENVRVIMSNMTAREVAKVAICKAQWRSLYL